MTEAKTKAAPKAAPIVEEIKPEVAALPEGHVSFRVGKAGAGQIATGEYEGGVSVYFKRGDIVVLPTYVAEDLEQRALGEIED